MKPTERDDLLIRLDERTNNIWKLTEKQEEHLAKINDVNSKQGEQIASNKTSIKWIIRILIGAGLVGGAGAGISQLFTG